MRPFRPVRYRARPATAPDAPTFCRRRRGPQHRDICQPAPPSRSSAPAGSARAHPDRARRARDPDPDPGPGVDRGALVPPARLRSGAGDRVGHAPDPVRPRVRRDGRRGRLEPELRLPVSTGLRALDAGAGQPRPVPRGDRAAAPARHDRRTGGARPVRRRGRLAAVGDRPALDPRRDRRPGRPAVPHRPRLLHVHAAGPAVRRVLPHGRRGARGHRRRRDAVPLRRSADRRPARRGAAHHAGGPRAPVGHRRRDHAAHRGELLARPVLDPHQEPGQQVRRRLVHRRARRHPVQGDPGGHRGLRRRARSSSPRSAGTGAAGDRRRPHGRRGDRGRRHLPGRRAEVPGAAEPAGRRVGVHLAQHRRDARRLRARGRREDRRTRPRSPPRPGRCARTPRRRRRSGSSTRRWSARRSSSCSRSAASTTSRTRCRSTATRSTARAATP